VVADDPAEIRIQGHAHSIGWVILPIKVGAFVNVNFVLDTSFPLTRISESTRDILQAFGLITPLSAKVVRIHEMHVGGDVLPEIEARVSNVVSRLGLEAMLGLNFLGAFTEVCFHRPSVALTLRP
jgi:hypothetical protein